jgi:hypothetical protein
MSNLAPPTPPASVMPEKKHEKPIYKQKWFLVLVGLMIIGYFASDSKDSKSGTSKDATSSASTTVRPTPTIATTTTTTLPPYTDEEYAAALKQMSIKNDDVVGSRFIEAKSSPDYSNEDAFQIYISGTQTSIGGLRFLARYAGSDWLFFEKIVVNVDGRVFNLDFSYFEVEHENAGGGVWEWIDIVPSSENISMLNLIANSKSTIVRVQGENYKNDRELTAKDKKAISDVFTVMDGYKRGKLSWNS